MKSIASLLVRAKTLKRFGSRTTVERQLAKVIDHPDFETLCSLLESIQKFSFVSKANEEVVDDYNLVDDITDQDVLDLDLDISLDHDAEESDAHGDDILLVDDLIEDSDPSAQVDLEEILESVVADDSLEIIFDNDEELDEDKSENPFKGEVEAKLVRAKLAASPKKIIVSKASILAKKKSLG